MTHIEPELLVKAVFDTAMAMVGDAKQTHPEDVMTTVSIVTENIYHFIANLPDGYTIRKW